MMGRYTVHSARLHGRDSKELTHVLQHSTPISSNSVLLGTTIVVGGPLAAARAAGEKPGSKMQLGFCTYLWGQDWDLPTLIANCEKAEILAVETRTEHPHGVEPSLNESHARRSANGSPIVVWSCSALERMKPTTTQIRQT